MKKASKHPYSEFEGSREWTAINQAITNLVANRDIDKKTAREYIVGDLCKALASAK
jgi:hypothetical protein